MRIHSAARPAPGWLTDVPFKPLNYHKYTQRDDTPISPKVYLHEEGVVCENSIFPFILRKKKKMYCTHELRKERGCAST